MPLPMFVVLLTVGIDAIGVGIVLPVMPDLIASTGVSDIAGAALWGGVLSSSYAVGQFICSPVLGALSDRFGRRPVLLVSLAVITLDFVVMALAQSIWVLLAARIVAGVAAATYATALAFVADITAEDERAAGFGRLSAAMGLGLVLGPVMGGWVGTGDPRGPFWLAAAFAGANFVLGCLVLPETLPVERRTRFSLCKATPFTQFREIRRLPGLAPLITVFGLLQVSAYVYPAIWAFYTQASLGWEAGTIGLSLAYYGVVLAFAQAWLGPKLVERFGAGRTILAGLCLGLACLIGYGTAPPTLVVWILTPINAIASLAMPTLQSVMSSSTDRQTQGRLQGVLGSVTAVATILSPLIMTQAFYWGTNDEAGRDLAGAPFLLAAVLSATAIVLFLRITRNRGSIR